MFGEPARSGAVRKPRRLDAQARRPLRARAGTLDRKVGVLHRRAGTLYRKARLLDRQAVDDRLKLGSAANDRALLGTVLRSFVIRNSENPRPGSFFNEI